MNPFTAPGRRWARLSNWTCPGKMATGSWQESAQESQSLARQQLCPRLPLVRCLEHRFIFLKVFLSCFQWRALLPDTHLRFCQLRCSQVIGKFLLLTFEATPGHFPEYEWYSDILLSRMVTSQGLSGIAVPHYLQWTSCGWIFSDELTFIARSNKCLL